MFWSENSDFFFLFFLNIFFIGMKYQIFVFHFRRLNTLNKCAIMKIGTPTKKEVRIGFIEQ